MLRNFDAIDPIPTDIPEFREIHEITEEFAALPRPPRHEVIPSYWEATCNRLKRHLERARIAAPHTGLTQQVLAFNRGDHGRGITEADCRQTKQGTAQADDELRPGDRVVCVDASGLDCGLKVGGEYTVDAFLIVGDKCVTLKEYSPSPLFRASRFRRADADGIGSLTT